jgi:hypothetical protein
MIGSVLRLKYQNKRRYSEMSIFYLNLIIHKKKSRVTYDNLRWVHQNE